MRRRSLPSYDRVRDLFDYDPRTGILRWKVKRANKEIGDAVGSVKTNRYLRVGIDYEVYRVHLIIWVWMTGCEPVAQIDHHNTVKTDNRWKNLREATKSQNMANRGAQANSRSGVKGVWWYRAYGKWTAQIWKDGKQHFIGYFDNLHDAAAARAAKERELFGKFARA